MLHSFELDKPFIIDSARFNDLRGEILKIFPLKRAGGEFITLLPTQVLVVRNVKKRTFRGLHFQLPPTSGVKVVTLLSGNITDFCVDLNIDKDTFGVTYTYSMSAVAKGNTLIIPPNYAHGYLTHEDQTTLIYQLFEVFDPEAQRCLSFADPALGLTGLNGPLVISDRDKCGLTLVEIENEIRNL